MVRHVNPLIGAAALGLIVLAGCSAGERVQGPESTAITTDKAAQEPQYVPGAYLSIAWPFPGESPGLWYGDEGDRSGGVAGSYCGGTRNNTHSGAETYARDLNRNDETDAGRDVCAGFTGKVVVAGDRGDGYGICVVIYDASRRVAVRYAHLQSAAVSYGQTVSIRQRIGKVGRTGNVTGPHLHLAAYENINDNYGNPIIPTLCDSDYYACAIYFFC